MKAVFIDLKRKAIQFKSIVKEKGLLDLDSIWVVLFFFYLFLPFWEKALKWVPQVNCVYPCPRNLSRIFQSLLAATKMWRGDKLASFKVEYLALGL